MKWLRLESRISPNWCTCSLALTCQLSAFWPKSRPAGFLAARGLCSTSRVTQQELKCDRWYWRQRECKIIAVRQLGVPFSSDWCNIPRLRFSLVCMFINSQPSWLFELFFCLQWSIRQIAQKLLFHKTIAGRLTSFAAASENHYFILFASRLTVLFIFLQYFFGGVNQLFC